MMMLDLTGILIQHQKSGAVTLFKGSLCNKLLRQVKVKIRFFHTVYAPIIYLFYYSNNYMRYYSTVIHPIKDSLYNYQHFSFQM